MASGEFHLLVFAIHFVLEARQQQVARGVLLEKHVPVLMEKVSGVVEALPGGCTRGKGYKMVRGKPNVA